MYTLLKQVLNLAEFSSTIMPPFSSTIIPPLLSTLCFTLVKILCTRYRPRNTAQLALYQVVYLRLKLDLGREAGLQTPSHGRMNCL